MASSLGVVVYTIIAATMIFGQVMQTITQRKSNRCVSLTRSLPQPEPEPRSSWNPRLQTPSTVPKSSTTVPKSRKPVRKSQTSTPISPTTVRKSPYAASRSVPVFDRPSSVSTKPQTSDSKSSTDFFSLFKLPLQLISSLLLPLKHAIRQNTTSMVSPIISFNMPLTFSKVQSSNPLPVNINNSPITCNHLLGNKGPCDHSPYNTNDSPNQQPDNTNNPPNPCNSPNNQPNPCNSNNQPNPCNSNNPPNPCNSNNPPKPCSNPNNQPNPCSSPNNQSNPCNPNSSPTPCDIKNPPNPCNPKDPSYPCDPKDPTNPSNPPPSSTKPSPTPCNPTPGNIKPSPTISILHEQFDSTISFLCNIILNKFGYACSNYTCNNETNTTDPPTTNVPCINITTTTSKHVTLTDMTTPTTSTNTDTTTSSTDNPPTSTSTIPPRHSTQPRIMVKPCLSPIHIKSLTPCSTIIPHALHGHALSDKVIEPHLHHPLLKNYPSNKVVYPIPYANSHSLSKQPENYKSDDYVAVKSSQERFLLDILKSLISSHGVSTAPLTNK